MRVEPIKKLKKILATLAMLSIIFCALIMPAQSEQSDVESPNANFFAFSTSGDAPFDAAFMDSSTGNPTEWYWEFGDGETSTQQDPTHTYSEPGSYTVILTATNDAGSDVVTKAGYIIVKGSTTTIESTEDVDSTTDTESTTDIESTTEAGSTTDIEPTVDTAEKPVAKFSGTPKSGIEPLTIEFTDKSTENPIEWYWDFGDGETSTQQDPDHTYSEPGSYTVILTATNDAGSDITTKAGYIKVEESTTDTEKPVADFDAYVLSGTAPFHVVFLDESKGEPTSWNWDFGDGTTSSQRDPEHTYSEPGSYTVKLTATNDAGSDKKIKTDYIIVTEPATNTESKTDVEPTKDKESTTNTAEKPVAKFFATPKSGNTPLTVEFTDTSTENPTEWYWDFGDGSTSDSENPVHEYSQAGTYTITLTTTNDAGSDKVIKTGYIKAKESTKDTKVSASKSVSLSYLKVAAETDPLRPQGGTTPGAVDSVKIVEAALAEAGYLDETYAYDGSYGTKTLQAYKNFQKDLGSSPQYCDGIPGVKDLTKLGSLTMLDNKYKFTVSTSMPDTTNIDTSTISDSTSSYKQPTQTTQSNAANEVQTPAAKSSASTTSGIVTDARGNSYDLLNKQYKNGWGPGVYATGKGYPQKVQSTLNEIGILNTPQDITDYINNYVGKRHTLITADMVVQASQKYHVSCEIIIAIMLRETQLGTDGSKGSLGYNWGNVGNTDELMKSGGSVKYPTPQSGVDAVAKNLAQRSIKVTSTTINTEKRPIQSSGSKPISESESLPVKSTDTSKENIFSWKYWFNKFSNPVTTTTQKQTPSSNTAQNTVDKTSIKTNNVDPDIHNTGKLKGKTIVIDPGHMSTEKSRQESKEYEINHKVATKLESLLIAEGANVYLTDKMGDKDEPTIGKRAKSAINEDPDLFISIHTNADIPTARGVEVWKWSANDKSRFREKELATSIYNNVKKETQQPSTRGLKEKDSPWDGKTKPWYHVGVHILSDYEYPCPAVLVELDFTTYSSPVTFDGKTYSNMRELMVSTEYQNSAAKALRNSIVDYFT